MDKDISGIAHFLSCAHEGRMTTSSGGEQAAFRIAKALLSIADDLQRVDSDIAAGAGFAVHLLGGTYEKRNTMRTQLQQATGER